MLFKIISFIISFFSYCFNILYFNIFKNFKRYFFLFFKKSSTLTIKKCILHIWFLIMLCVLNFSKIFFFIYVYILWFYKFFLKIYIDLTPLFKKTYKIIIDLYFWLLWFDLLIHLKVLKIKFQDSIDEDLFYYNLKWYSYYYYYYIIYMLQDSFNILYWFVRHFLRFRYNVLYWQFIFYFKNIELKSTYYIKLFVAYIQVYYVGLIKDFFKNLFNNFKKKFRWKKKGGASLFSNIKFWYHKKKRLLKEVFYNNIKKPLLLLNYSINNGVEHVFFVLFKTGANFIIYYFYKFIKILYSTCVYIWKSDVIYRFLKFFERKKW